MPGATKAIGIESRKTPPMITAVGCPAPAGTDSMTKGEWALALGFDSTADGPEGELARDLGYDSTDPTPTGGGNFNLTGSAVRFRIDRRRAERASRSRWIARRRSTSGHRPGRATLEDRRLPMTPRFAGSGRATRRQGTADNPIAPLTPAGRDGGGHAGSPPRGGEIGQHPLAGLIAELEAPVGVGVFAS